MKDLRCFFHHVDWKKSRREFKRTELEIWEHENEKHTALSFVFFNSMTVKRELISSSKRSKGSKLEKKKN